MSGAGKARLAALARWAGAAGVLVGIAGFWSCAVIGAAQQPGYDSSQDYLSALAAVGAQQPGWGMAMLAGGVLALAGLATIVWASAGAGAAAVGSPAARAGAASAWQRASAVLLLLAALMVLVATAARVDCTAGAAGCNAGPEVAADSVSGQVHAWAVAAYQVTFSVALLLLAWSRRAARRRGGRVVAVTAATGALLTLVLAVDPLPLDPGLSQRVWVAAGHFVVLAVAATLMVNVRERDRDDQWRAKTA